MSSPWHILEDVPAHSAAAADWELHLDDYFPAAREVFLQKAKRKASSVQCPHVEGCTHELKPRGDGYVAKCKDDDGAGCDDFLLSADAAEVWEVNLKRLGAAIAGALKCDARDAKLELYRTRQIASLGSSPLPILLTVQHDEDGFSEVVARLVAKLPKGFVLLAPSSRFCTATATDLLGRVNAGFCDLATHVELLESGKLHAPKSGAELFKEHLPEHSRQEPGIARATPEYFIKQEGARRRKGKQDRTEVSTWRISYKGAEVLMPAWVGAELLLFLIQRQGKTFDARTLTEAVRKSRAGASHDQRADINAILYGGESGGDNGDNQQGRVGDVNERDVIWDLDQIAKAIAKIKSLQEEVQLYEAEDDFSSDSYQETKGELQDLQDLLAHNAKNVKGKWVPKEYQKGTAKQKAELIGKHFRKLLDEHLREACRPLYDHLNDKKVLSFGISNSYCPKPKVPWVIELQGMKKGT